ncbi:MAG: hypothetical protein K2J10_04645, partial [Muribaculaceae bacterium]|nr:hypothetical protein [Muribaculaceae bacterium]
MKILKESISAIFIFSVLCSSCADKDLPSDPVLTMPVQALCLKVSGEDYTACLLYKTDAADDLTRV